MIEGERKSLLNKHIFKKITAIKPVLQNIVEEVLHTEERGKCSHKTIVEKYVVRLVTMNIRIINASNNKRTETYIYDPSHENS